MKRSKLSKSCKYASCWLIFVYVSYKLCNCTITMVHFYAIITHVYYNDVTKRVSTLTTLNEENFENVLSFAVF